jgi:hypothetical protein
LAFHLSLPHLGHTDTSAIATVMNACLAVLEFHIVIGYALSTGYTKLDEGYPPE